SEKDDDMQRISYTWAMRNEFAIPLDMTVDRADCSMGCTATSGRFANARYFIEYGPRRDKTTLKGINPGMTWQIAPTLKLEAQANATKSDFTHEAPTVMPITAAGSGLVASYDATNGGVPSITFNNDVNDPANLGWAGGRVNI